MIEAADRALALGPPPKGELELTQAEFDLLKAEVAKSTRMYPTDPLNPPPPEFMGLRIVIKG
jgi:hypothetical protein